jgi:hypothetical protein
MNFLTTSLASVCIGLAPGPQLDGCNKAIEAASKQTGLDAVGSDIENKCNDKAISIAKDTLGVKSVNFLGTTAYIVKSIQTQSISVEFKF